MAEKDDLKNELISDSSNVPKPKSSADQEALNEEKPKDKSSKKKDKSPTDSGNMSSSSKLPNLYSRFVHSFENALSQLTDEPHVKPKLESLDLEGVANYIKTKQPRNILFAVGAGISTSAGIPDFRTPGTGLYSNLQKYQLPSPMSVFELDYFQRRPEPFFSLARELFDEKIKPTPCHYFMRLMENKGYLRRVFTQNIDSLEYLAGISPSKIITAHGSHQKSTCLKCKKSYSYEWMNDFLRQTEIVVPKCSCGGLIKPNITFFGEQLPAQFFTSAVNDFPKCDLLIIIGTSLTVQPFASIVHEVAENCPRLLINLTEVGKISKRERAKGYQGLCYAEQDNDRDVFWKGESDTGVVELAKHLGWDQELKMMIDHEWKKIDEKTKKADDSKAKEKESQKL
ncbi:hypothetical protein M3Y94_00164200 [Aphelenchoides besseyi]|nr:hypothetical protein M3Y94_00164200 [Aphelenchoides besseyi]KAI6237039.1 NAD-dependent protein deacetylase [Aphelenchoides besseyi]